MRRALCFGLLLVGCGAPEQDPLFDPAIGGPTGMRVMAGLQYSVRGLYQGVLARWRAQADCQRYRVSSEMHGMLQANQEMTSRAALAARLAVMEGGLPRAYEILQGISERLRRNAATLDELQATQVRVEALRTLVIETRKELATASEEAGVKGRAVDRLRQREEAEAKVGAFDSRLRRSLAWDLSLRGGTIGSSAGLSGCRSRGCCRCR